MRETDKEAAQYMRKYGPFNLSVIANRNKHKCDFCQDQPSRIIKADATLNPMTTGQEIKTLWVCLSNECPEALLGDEQAKQIRFSALASGAGGTFVPSQNLEEILATDEGERLVKLLEEYTKGDELLTLMRQAWKFHEKGFGKGWRIMPSLFQQYTERESLTTKQISVVRRFVKTCQTEVIGPAPDND
jgi:hypothetical protein